VGKSRLRTACFGGQIPPSPFGLRRANPAFALWASAGKAMKISQLPGKLITFLKEVRIELKRVTWLSRQDAIKHTIMVLGFSLVVAAFLGSLDFLFSWLLNKFVI